MEGHPEERREGRREERGREREEGGLCWAVANTDPSRQYCQARGSANIIIHTFIISRGAGTPARTHTSGLSLQHPSIQPSHPLAVGVLPASDGSDGGSGPRARSRAFPNPTPTSSRVAAHWPSLPPSLFPTLLCHDRPQVHKVDGERVECEVGRDEKERRTQRAAHPRARLAARHPLACPRGPVARSKQHP